MTCEILNCEYWGKVISCFSITKCDYTTSWLLLPLFLYFNPSVDLLCARPPAMSWACGLGWDGILAPRSLLDGLMEKAAHIQKH